MQVERTLSPPSLFLPSPPHSLYHPLSLPHSLSLSPSLHSYHGVLAYTATCTLYCGGGGGGGSSNISSSSSNILGKSLKFPQQTNIA